MFTVCGSLTPRHHSMFFQAEWADERSSSSMVSTCWHRSGSTSLSRLPEKCRITTRSSTNMPWKGSWATMIMMSGFAFRIFCVLRFSFCSRGHGRQISGMNLTSRDMSGNVIKLQAAMQHPVFYLIPNTPHFNTFRSKTIVDGRYCQPNSQSASSARCCP